MRSAMILCLLFITVASLVVWFNFQRDVTAAEQRLSGVSHSMTTPEGTLEWAEEGSGAPLLMIHGTGGGFDQGMLFAEGLAERGVRVIAPSRFGYLGSAIPSDPSPARQADAFAQLLDRVGVEKAVVAGGSAGAMSAAAFALRYPDRCAGLILLVPAANLSGRDPVEMTGWQKRAVAALAESDFLYWASLQLAPDQVTATLLGTDPALVARASLSERRRVVRIRWAMLPISRRSRGMVEDAKRAGSVQPIDYRRIGVPTLILSVADDRFGTAATARLLASQIAGARVHIYSSGGHIWVGHQADVAQRVAAFVLAQPADGGLR